MSPDQTETLKHTGDVFSVVVAAGAITALLPPFAALLTILWTAGRLYEMVTGLPFSHSRFAKWITGRE